MQVYCCWSGLAKVRAEPFRQGLRFRAQQDGECKTSDRASLLCDDLHRLGFSRALVDSGVLVTRQLELSAKLSNTVKQANRMPYVRRSRWVEVQGAGSPWQFTVEELAQRTYPALACCTEPDISPDSVGGDVDSGSADLVNSTVQMLGEGQQLSLEQLLATAAAGGSSAQQHCQAYNLLDKNHTLTFLQQQQQQQLL
jgi:hypothetical protein